MTINRWRSWLAACGALSLGIAGGGSAHAGQTSPRTTMHDITSTGCLERAAATPSGTSGTAGAMVGNETGFVLTHAVTVIPDADQRTGFSSAKATIPNRVKSETDTPDEHGLSVKPDQATRHVGQMVAITGTMRGSQLKAHSIRTISLVCQ
jgi:hypothetical protein